MTVIEFNATGYIIELLLPYCNEPSASPSEAPSISPSVSRSSLPSSLPSLTTTTAPSSIPSADPSALSSAFPTTTLSLFPSSMPSQVISKFPSSMPTLPFCDIDDVMEKIYEAPISFTFEAYCFRLDLSIDGLFEVDTSGKDCGSTTFKNQTILSIVKFTLMTSYSSFDAR